jgi:DNA-binding NtrC family response regulator
MESAFRILILDDEQIVCDRLRPTLEKLGFQVETFMDSGKAVARLAEQRFDVLVTDLKMPGVGGLDVLTFAREHCGSTKVIVITGFATTDTAREAMDGGAVEFIPKPFKMSRLRDLIVRLAEERAGQARTTGDESPGTPVHD